MEDNGSLNDAAAGLAALIQAATRDNLERTNSVVKPDTIRTHGRMDQVQSVY